jgi:hypothetical protein
MIPLAAEADRLISRLAECTASSNIAQLDGETLLGERAMLANWTIPGRVSAGRGAQLFEAVGDTLALNLARPEDRELLPALFETDALDAGDDAAIAAHMRRCEADALLLRGRSMGLAMAAEHERLAPPASLGEKLAEGCRRSVAARRIPRVLDLSALWAGPLATHLLWLAGAEVVKVESRTRPDGMRNGDQYFYALLNQGKASIAIDFNNAHDRRALKALIASCDIVIESARPRALVQLGIEACEFVASTPGLVWVTITAHGAQGEAANWVGFGDDCSVAAGLSAALRSVTGCAGFVGDAIADPLTGIAAALLAWDSWQAGAGGRFGLALSQVAAHCLVQQQAHEPARLSAQLAGWAHARGQPFPSVKRRPIGSAAVLGEHTYERLALLNWSGCPPG